MELFIINYQMEQVLRGANIHSQLKANSRDFFVLMITEKSMLTEFSFLN